MKKSEELLKLWRDCFKTLTKSNRYSDNEIFYDWIHATAYALSNNNTENKEKYNEREKMYVNIMKKYSSENKESFSKLIAILVNLFETDVSDWLGQIIMEEGFGNNNLDQYFTPQTISDLMALLVNPSKSAGTFKMLEPTCGSGTMIIAAIKDMKEKGYNYQNKFFVEAWDLSENALLCAFIQCQLLGIEGEFVNGNTLTKEKFSVYHSVSPEHMISKSYGMLK